MKPVALFLLCYGYLEIYTHAGWRLRSPCRCKGFLYALELYILIWAHSYAMPITSIHHRKCQAADRMQFQRCIPEPVS
eukprot:g3308.t1